jgi:transcription elongation factor GreA
MSDMAEAARNATPLSGASDLLRSLGLLVDGPVRWAEPAPSRAPGVFLVELPGGAPEAPLDLLALRRWLERVPQLQLDGTVPTPQVLAQRLGQFWLPSEPILYVGRSTRAIGGRVAALYATPLGDARPHAGGHWLKTLADSSKLRVWWSETEAHEEYEDALLDAIAERQSAPTRERLPDGSVVLPFANLEGAGGRFKQHGLKGFLRAASDSADAAPKAPPAKARRAQRTNLSPTSSQSRRAVAKAHIKPAAEPTYVSSEGLVLLQAELDQLRSGVRPGVIARVKAARELGDLRENSEYESARKEQSFVEGRIQTLEAMLKSAVVVSGDPAGETVGIGSTVVVESEAEEQTFVLVGSAEADPAAGRISYASPVGQALLGKRQGDDVTIRLPRGEIQYRLREVR